MRQMFFTAFAVVLFSATLAASGSIKVGKLTSHIAPAYPRIVREARIQGDVVLEFVVSTKGEVLEVFGKGGQTYRMYVVSSDHPLLDSLALEAVKKWKYEPTLLNGVAVPVVRRAIVEFRLVPVLPSELDDRLEVRIISYR